MRIKPLWGAKVGAIIGAATIGSLGMTPGAAAAPLDTTIPDCTSATVNHANLSFNVMFRVLGYHVVGTDLGRWLGSGTGTLEGETKTTSTNYPGGPWGPFPASAQNGATTGQRYAIAPDLKANIHAVIKDSNGVIKCQRDWQIGLSSS